MNLLNRHWNRTGNIYISLAIILLFIFPSIAFAGNGGTSIDHSNIGSILAALVNNSLCWNFTVHSFNAPIYAKFLASSFPKVSAFWALVLAIPFFYFFKGTAVYSIAHIFIADYIPFIILLWALFTVSGGIYIKGSLKGTPAVNSLLLLIGTILASVIGTTGASVLMIRPVLRSNSWRKHRVHTIVFFIFLVSNIGGALTPLGDPPLFLGFLHGVPFFWTLKIFPQMAFASAILLFLHLIIDSYWYKKEDKSALQHSEAEPLKIEGALNFIFLAGIIGGVLFSGMVRMGEINIFGIHQTIENLIRDALLIVMGLLSLVFTRSEVRKGNDFSWAPIAEVAYLFAGIFMTIIPGAGHSESGRKWSAGMVNKISQHTGALFLGSRNTFQLSG